MTPPTKHKFVSGIEYKRCSKCFEWKSLIEFNKNNASYDKLKCDCKQCNIKRNKDASRTITYVENKRRAHRHIHKEEQKQCSRCEEWKSLNNFWKSACNWDGLRNKCIQCENIWKENNKEYVTSYKREYEKLKKKRDIHYHIKCKLSCRIYDVLHKKRMHKNNTTIHYLKCGLDHLKARFEGQFEIGMSWSNIGTWHIDHIIPCNSFDLSNVVEQYACFHYKNLQPLWGLDNIRKGSTCNALKKQLYMENFIQTYIVP